MYMQGTAENRLSEFRQSKKITQEDLAKAIGVSRQTIIAIEKEKCDPSVCLAIKIANYFNKKVEDVFCLPCKTNN